MMEARFCDAATKQITVYIACLIECDYQIERSTCNLAGSRSDHSRMQFIFRNSNSALMRMRGKVFDHAGSVVGIPKQLVDGLYRSNLLIVTITA